MNVSFNEAIAELNGKINLSPNENILTIARIKTLIICFINIHYFYNIFNYLLAIMLLQFLRFLFMTTLTYHHYHFYSIEYILFYDICCILYQFVSHLTCLGSYLNKDHSCMLIITRIT